MGEVKHHGVLRRDLVVSLMAGGHWAGYAWWSAYSLTEKVGNAVICYLQWQSALI